MFRLNPIQKATLEKQLKKARDASERNRLCAILGHHEGLSIDLLAQALRVSHATICNYLKDYLSEDKTNHEPRGGGRSKLSEDQEESLLKHLRGTTYLKVKQICIYVRMEYGINYSRSGMTTWLENHGFVYKRPKKIPGKLDPEQQERFIKEYETLIKSLGLDEELYFIDGVHPEHQSQAVCGWIQKGEQKTLQSTGKQRRLHIVGALRLKEMKIFTQEYETIDTEAMLDFFKKLEKGSTASRIYVVLDNARANKNNKVEEFLKSSRIKAIYLPPYSPNLNPIERLWKIMRETKIYNRYYQSCTEFFREIREFFTNDVPKIAHTWAERITDKFQVVRPNPINLAV